MAFSKIRNFRSSTENLKILPAGKTHVYVIESENIEWLQVSK